MSKNSIPVLYYHSVADHNIERPWSFLSCPINIFKAQMNWLKSKGYYTCDWKELYKHMKGSKCLPAKTVHIQFDDGFLDNWSVVFPIMKELNMKYTVLLTPDFIEKRGTPRSFVKSCNDEDINEWWGYLNKAEIKQMAESGIVEFQAHGYTHTWYEYSDEIIDVFDGSQLYPHIFWNQFVKEKPNWLSIEWNEMISRGYPVFKYEKSLNNDNRFYPNPKFVDECIRVFEKFDKNEAKKAIIDLETKYKNEEDLGRFESKGEYILRINHELVDSKKELEEIVGNSIDFLVWPGGGNNEDVQRAAFKAGYKMVSKGTDLNEFNCGRKQVTRMAGFVKFNYFSKILNIFVLKVQMLRGSGSKLFENIAILLKGIRRKVCR